MLVKDFNYFLVVRAQIGQPHHALNQLRWRLTVNLPLLRPQLEVLLVSRFLHTRFSLPSILSLKKIPRTINLRYACFLRREPGRPILPITLQLLTLIMSNLMQQNIIFPPPPHSTLPLRLLQFQSLHLHYLQPAQFLDCEMLVSTPIRRTKAVSMRIILIRLVPSNLNSYPNHRLCLQLAPTFLQ